MRSFAIICFILAAPLIAAPPTPQETVLQLVPPDTAVCFVVQHLRDRAEIVAKSPFAAWAGGQLNAKVAGSDELKALQFVEGMFKDKLGMTVQQLRDDILGDILVHAYQPGPTGKPEDERSAVLLYARDAARLKAVLDKLNDFQKETGELATLKSHEYQGLAYVERVKVGGGKSDFYRANSNLFVFASTEDALKAVMARELNGEKSSPIITALADRGATNAFLACVIQPRAFDGQINQPDPTDTDAEKAGKAQMAKLWRAMDQCVIYLAADADLELGVSIAYRNSALPEELKSLLAAAPKRSPLWQAVPADSLLAVAFQAETNVLLEAVGSFLPPADRPKLRKQIEDMIGPVVGNKNLPAVLAGLGPDLGFWIAPSPETWFPRIVAALHLKKAPDPMVPIRVQRISGFYLQAFQVNYNRRHEDQMELVDDKVGATEIRRLVNEQLFPPGVSPTLAVQGDFLIVASSPQAFASFQAPLVAETPRSESPVFIVSAKEIHKHLATHKGAIAEWLAKKQDRTAKEVTHEIDTLLPILEAFDRMEMVVRGDDNSRTLAVKVKPIKALK